MTTKEFIEKLREKNPNVSREYLHKIVGDALDLIDEEARNGSLSIFRRTWRLKIRPPRTGRNPRTGESIQIPEVKTVTYRKRV